MRATEISELELERSLERALSRLRGACRRLEGGLPEDFEAVTDELTRAISGIEGAVFAESGRKRRLITNAICELQAAQRSVAQHLQGTGESLRAAQGQRRAITAYAKANRG